MSLVSSTCSLCLEDGGALLWRNDRMRVVTVEEPGLPGYTRVIWQQHQPEMTDLTTEEQQALMHAVFLTERLQRRILHADKVNLASLGNMTPHLHWHITPRWRDDPWFPDSIWTPRQERNAVVEAAWQTRRAAIAALMDDYTAALRTELDQQFPSMNRLNSPSPATQPAPSNQLRELPSQQLASLHPAWQAALDTAAAREALARLDQFIGQRLQEGATIYPARIFRALETLAPDDVRVVILGQDPYHGPEQAQGLAFSVPADCPTPPSLRNIFNELARDYPDQAARRHNDLSDWSDQGVLLLNTSLTVEQGAAGSHSRKGWEIITDALIDAVARAPQPKAFLLWGNHAQSKQTIIESGGQTCKIFKANHPSPLSALRPPRPFIGCGHFSQVNAWLNNAGLPTIDWINTDS